MGIERLEALTALLLTLPGVAFTYNGDEIGMQDYREISWEDTTDPLACNADPFNYTDLSRDPQRTPFQWDNSVNSGFNTGGKPWIPVHPSYSTNNLAAQENTTDSFYNFYKSLLELRHNETFTDGDFESADLSESVFGFIRSKEDTKFIVLINLNSTSATVSLEDLNVQANCTFQVLLKSQSSNYKYG